MAYLRWAAELISAERLVSFVDSALEKSGETTILDLCSGGGGPILPIVRELSESSQTKSVELTLSDLHPDAATRAQVAALADPRIRYVEESVDAVDVPSDLPGLRTMFNAFHHLRPEQARQVLSSAVEGGRSIAIVEVMRRHPLTAIGMLLTPLIVLLAVPFLRPFRPAWLFWTYVVPVIPLFILWDGFVSSLRIYDEEELLALASEADPTGRHVWRVEAIPMPPQPVPGIALLGTPRPETR